ncbi:DNA binding domain%2C excisionase family [Mycobacteroides abscessus]|uniref:helix-turn-helix domain-containing protein n=1 Tax=Mycobacteroides abscessus TaxID=36809 RepID=UPI0005E6A3EF|nr:helix-turn-helix domain-containing protein [Mycobacteroides abscessus]CPS10645.1 DNA binding domain%2C excisionase family [Mycobacteroides abscessus]CPS50333.1 DNA binding domain%2C excisionase family [Mycobacteroides abscessus]CPS93890.1 DNA binding domain%2C excisionase family [Mycobacteroides abscessus]CPS94124.1 DNA binding domain%2C excisionase family [Mycobacteroides abscessus]CPT61939.1 DNA binding domain%2C excisionase family [Mycobacteroides abscessus]
MRLTIEEVAAELGISRPSVRTLIRRGDLPAVRDTSVSGHPYFIARGDLDRHLRGAKPVGEPVTAEQLWRRRGYLTVAEAAAELGMSEWSVTYRVRRGDLRGSRRTSRGKILISRADLDECRDRFGVAAANAPDSLSVREVAADLGCSRATVQQLIQQSKLPAARTGSGKTAAYRISRSDLDEYRRSRCVAPDMLTVAEAAAAIGLPENAVRLALSAGRLRSELVGARRYIRCVDLDEYMTHRGGRYKRSVAARQQRHQADIESLHAEGFLTPTETAAAAGVTRVTVQRWITAGKLRSVKRGQLRGVRPEWIAEMRSGRLPDPNETVRERSDHERH